MDIQGGIMEASRYIYTADTSGEINITVKIPDGQNKKFEVIILPVEENILYQESMSIEMMKLQQESGFAKTVLGSPEEDIWNDLI
jgi:hypothetical protein